MENNITIIGAGSWGTAVAVLLSEGYECQALDGTMNRLITRRQGKTLLPGVVLKETYLYHRY